MDGPSPQNVTLFSFLLNTKNYGHKTYMITILIIEGKYSDTSAIRYKFYVNSTKLHTQNTFYTRKSVVVHNLPSNDQKYEKQVHS